MFSFKANGDWKATTQWLKRLEKKSYKQILQRYANEGVRALQSATPKKTGLTAASWSYEIVEEHGNLAIYWHNSNVKGKGVNIALILFYGHGTRNGGYVQGRDYINPAIRPIFDKMADAAWKEVSGS